MITKWNVTSLLSFLQTITNNKCLTLRKPPYLASCLARVFPGARVYKIGNHIEHNFACILQAKVRVVKRLLLLRVNADRSFSITKDSYMRYFYRRVRHGPVFQKVEGVYIGKLSSVKTAKANKLQKNLQEMNLIGRLSPIYRPTYKTAISSWACPGSLVPCQLAIMPWRQ